MEKRIVVIEGPSGAGKDSIMRELMLRYKNKFAKIISLSTRPMRDYEKQGDPYYFVTETEFDNMVGLGDIFEWTSRHGTKRGMSEKYINQILNDGKIALKDCDIIGVNALKSHFKNVLTIFITAPKDETARRMRERGDSEDDIIKRLKNYELHLTQGKYYDYILENINLKETVDKVCNIIYNAPYGKK
jgi:guanylate kinase